MAMSLTHLQAQLLDFIKKYQAENNGVSPSFDEMRQEMGLASKSGVHRLMQALEERGHITRPYYRARCIQIVPDNPFEGIPTRALIDELARRGELRLRQAAPFASLVITRESAGQAA